MAESRRLSRKKYKRSPNVSEPSAGIEIVDVQLLGGGGSRLLRIFIDKPEGVTHADCEFISQHVGTILDVEDVIPGRALHARSQLARRGAEAHQAARV